MAADATLIEGARRASRFTTADYLDALNSLGGNLATIVQNNLKTQEAARQRAHERMVAQIKSKKAKGDTYLTTKADEMAGNVNGPLQDSYGTVTADIQTFGKGQWLGNSDNNAQQAALSMNLSQAANDMGSISTHCGTWSKMLQPDSDYEGAPLSNAVSSEEFDYIANPQPAAKIIFEIPGEDAPREILIRDGKAVNAKDQMYMDEEVEDPRNPGEMTTRGDLMMNGGYKQLSFRYGLLKPIDQTESLTAPDLEQTDMIGPTMVDIDALMADGFEWVSADDIKTHVNNSQVNIDARGEIAKLGASQLSLGTTYSNASAGSSNSTTGEETRADKRIDFNPQLVRQEINTFIHADLKPHEMRSIINDPMVGQSTSMVNHLPTLFENSDIEKELAGVTTMVEGNEKLVFDLDGGGTVEGDAEINAMMDMIKNYDTENMSPDVKKAVDDLVKDYFFMYAKNQFILGAGGKYQSNMERGVTEVDETKLEDDPFSKIIDF
tara:strand:+ start:1248 stop:2729 length:1482 start_codon:yes stop_codon:yes gene_type:complete